MVTKRTQRDERAVQLTRYAARALGTLLLIIMSAFFLGYLINDVIMGSESLADLSAKDLAILSLHGMTLIGLALAWWREGWGAALILAPFGVRLVISLAAGGGVPVVGSFLPFILVGVLYLIVWWAERNNAW